MSRHTPRGLALLLALAAAARAWAVGPNQPEVTLAVDVPVTLQSVSASALSLLAYQTVRTDTGGNYTLNFSGQGLSGANHIDAMYLLPGGGFLMSADAPLQLRNAAGAMITYQPYDVVRYHPTGGPGGGYYYSAYLLGSTLGFGRGGNIDAVALDRNNNLLISVSTPSQLNGGLVQPADVVRVNGNSVVMVFQAASCSRCSWITDTSTVNVTGVEAVDNGDFYFTFGSPVAASGNDFMGGTVVLYNASLMNNALTLAWADNQFPKGAIVTDFSFRVSPGYVPNGASLPGPQLMLSKAGGGAIAMAWGASCAAATDPQPIDYAVYEGVIGSWQSYQSNACSTSNLTSATVTPLNNGASTFFVIVPHNNDFEGSYGVTSAGVDRPAAATPCQSSYAMPRHQMVRACP